MLTMCMKIISFNTHIFAKEQRGVTLEGQKAGTKGGKTTITQSTHVDAVCKEQPPLAFFFRD